AQQGWWGTVERALEASSPLRAQVRDVAPEELEPRPGVGPAPEAPEPPPELAAAIARVRAAPAPRPRTAGLPVTHLQDSFLCARRYRYAHQVGLTEFDSELAPDLADPDGDGPGAPPDPRFLGTLAHRLLERVELARIGTPALAGHLRELLWAQG